MSKSDLEKLDLINFPLKGGNTPFLAWFIKKSSTFGLVYAITVIFRAKMHKDNLV